MDWNGGWTWDASIILQALYIRGREYLIYNGIAIIDKEGHAKVCLMRAIYKIEASTVELSIINKALMTTVEGLSIKTTLWPHFWCPYICPFSPCMFIWMPPYFWEINGRNIWMRDSNVAFDFFLWKLGTVRAVGPTCKLCFPTTWASLQHHRPYILPSGLWWMACRCSRAAHSFDQRSDVPINLQHRIVNYFLERYVPPILCVSWISHNPQRSYASHYCLQAFLSNCCGAHRQLSPRNNPCLPVHHCYPGISKTYRTLTLAFGKYCTDMTWSSCHTSRAPSKRRDQGGRHAL